jgi:hypothetical protein
MDDGISRSDLTRDHKRKKTGFLNSLKFDWSLLLRGLKTAGSFGLMKGKLSKLNFQEDEIKQSIDARLAQLSEAKKKLNHKIEKVNRELALLEVSLKAEDKSPIVARLISEGQQATRELQIIDAELAQLRRKQRVQVTKDQASVLQDLQAR